VVAAAFGAAVGAAGAVVGAAALGAAVGCAAGAVVGAAGAVAVFDAPPHALRTRARVSMIGRIRRCMWYLLVQMSGVRSQWSDLRLCRKGIMRSLTSDI
jgi:hypothetical protein